MADYTFRRRARPLSLALALALLAGACGSPAGSSEKGGTTSTETNEVIAAGGSTSGGDVEAAGGWLTADSRVVMFLRLAGGADSLAGTVSAASPPVGSGPLEPKSVSVIGRQIDAQLILNVASQATWTGSLNPDGTLTLEAPFSDGPIETYVLHRATSDEYNAALANLRSDLAPIIKGDAAVEDYAASATTCSADDKFFTTTGTFTNQSGHPQGFTFHVSWVYQPTGLDKSSLSVATGELAPGASYTWHERESAPYSYTLPLRCDVVEVKYAG
jgi:hypothetical protein